MQLPAILGDDEIDAAAKLLYDYYTVVGRSGQPRTGSRFDTWAGGGDAPEVANRLTPDDLLSVSFLSVDVPGRAIIGPLETRADEVEELLSAIPSDVDLADVPGDEVDRFVGNHSPASQLWDLVRANDTGVRWDIGPTTASKILARKRPRLIPIYDSVIRKVTKIDSSMSQWIDWHAALTDGTGLPGRLDEIRTRSGITEPVSQLRVMDVVLWLHGKQLGIQPEEETVGAEEWAMAD